MAFDSSWFDSCEDVEVNLRLPKFRMMGRTRSLSALAEELGLNEIFETPERYFLGDIEQQVVIQVDEFGTIAAAFMDYQVVESDPENVSLDRPFAYLIRDRGTGTILLMGTYLDPTGHWTSR
jgi:serpin B